MQQYDSLIRTDNKRPLRCLIVDDSIFARKNLAKLLQGFGCDIAGEAADGQAALAEYDRLLPDIVLMDITMPHLEGIDAAEQLVRQHPDARVVMVSSVGSQENIVAALQKGARHFVHKPVKPEILYDVIRYVMGTALAAPVAAGESLQ